MKTKFAAGIFAFLFIVGFNVMLAQRDAKLFKAYDACKQFTHHPDCPNSWKTKPEFSHR
jgi:hypothetical protein